MPAEVHVSLPAANESISVSGSPGDMVVVETSAGAWRTSLTFGASSVRLAGPERTFTEPSAAHAVRHTVWVRTLPKPFDGRVSGAWLRNALHANRRGLPDIFGMALQYLHGAPAIFDGDLQIAGAASYGPIVGIDPQERSDFNDYLGVTWSYAEGRVDKPESHEFRCLDCSGYMRIIWGYRPSLAGVGRSSIPLCFRPSADRSAMPRRAYQMYDRGPGVVVIENGGQQATDFAGIAPGDLVFFDAETNDGTRIDHVGMFLGTDEGGHQRFISSRKTHNGPTLGDSGGKSILDGNDYWPTAFRAARRL